MPNLFELKDIVEKESCEHFNSCLLKLYHDGSEGMAWYRVAEKEMRRNGATGSLSWGAVRHFGFKHKQTKESVTQLLEEVC
ncbi:MAG: hypothetical protein OXC07_10515 [Kistimonas sp.]|nr:hypothetical protein [Kistimonas sp.]